jgi:hypothetical protein
LSDGGIYQKQSRRQEKKCRQFAIPRLHYAPLLMHSLPRLERVGRPYPVRALNPICRQIALTMHRSARPTARQPNHPLANMPNIKHVSIPGECSVASRARFLTIVAVMRLRARGAVARLLSADTDSKRGGFRGPRSETPVF